MWTNKKNIKKLKPKDLSIKTDLIDIFMQIPDCHVRAEWVSFYFANMIFVLSCGCIALMTPCVPLMEQSRTRLGPGGWAGLSHSTQCSQGWPGEWRLTKQSWAGFMDRLVLRLELLLGSQLWISKYPSHKQKLSLSIHQANGKLNINGNW